MISVDHVFVQSTHDDTATSTVDRRKLLHSIVLTGSQHLIVKMQYGTYLSKAHVLMLLLTQQID